MSDPRRSQKISVNEKGELFRPLRKGSSNLIPFPSAFEAELHAHDLGLELNAPAFEHDVLQGPTGDGFIRDINAALPTVVVLSKVHTDGLRLSGAINLPLPPSFKTRSGSDRR